MQVDNKIVAAVIVAVLIVIGAAGWATFRTKETPRPANLDAMMREKNPAFQQGGQQAYPTSGSMPPRGMMPAGAMQPGRPGGNGPGTGGGM
ncbi:MAG: hypothetical protein ACK47B_18325 [Armatimonadota bacterium]